MSNANGLHFLKSRAHDREIKNKALASKERPDKAAGENPRLPSLFARCSGVIRTAVKGFRKKNGSHYHYLQPAASGALGSVCCERMDMLPQTRAASPARDTVRQSRTLKMDHNAISTWGLIQHRLRFPRSSYIPLICWKSCGWVCMPASVVVVVV